MTDDLCVFVKRDELIARIKENRERHRTVFEAALDGYKKQALKELRDRVNAIKKGQMPSLHIDLMIPEDHTHDYDGVLDMLSMSEDPEVSISRAEFMRYVRDEWPWRRRWLDTNASYTDVSNA